MQEVGHNSCDAKADRYGKCVASRSEEMDPEHGLTKTDIHRLPKTTARLWNAECFSAFASKHPAASGTEPSKTQR